MRGQRPAYDEGMISSTVSPGQMTTSSLMGALSLPMKSARNRTVAAGAHATRAPSNNDALHRPAGIGRKPGLTKPAR